MPLVEDLDVFFRDWRHAAIHYAMRWDAVVPFLDGGGVAATPTFIGYLRRIPRLAGVGTGDVQQHDSEFKCKHADALARGIKKDDGIQIGTWSNGALAGIPVLFRVRRIEESSGLCQISVSHAVPRV